MPLLGLLLWACLVRAKTHSRYLSMCTEPTWRLTVMTLSTRLPVVLSTEFSMRVLLTRIRSCSTLMWIQMQHSTWKQETTRVILQSQTSNLPHGQTQPLSTTDGSHATKNWVMTTGSSHRPTTCLLKSPNTPTACIGSTSVLRLVTPWAASTAR